MQAFEGSNEVVNPCDPRALPTQPANQLEAQLGGKTAQIPQSDLLQQVPRVTPQHHINVEILRRVTVLTPALSTDDTTTHTHITIHWKIVECLLFFIID